MQVAKKAQCINWNSTFGVAHTDQELGSPIIKPPNTDAYIMEPMEPVMSLFVRVKYIILMSMLKYCIVNDSLQIMCKGTMRAFGTGNGVINFQCSLEDLSDYGGFTAEETATNRMDIYVEIYFRAEARQV